jgi:predicted nucleic acid-binding Zn ribbon protein
MGGCSVSGDGPAGEGVSGDGPAGEGVSGDQSGEFAEFAEFADDAGESGTDTPEESAAMRPLSGVDLARAALAKARNEARARGVAAPARHGRVGRAGRGGGARRDPGDPELLGETVARLLVERGWDVPAAVAGVTQRWVEIAGKELADHCRPEKFDSGVLSLVSESTAWATQVRLLVPQLHRRIEDVIGHGVVTRIEVRGPTGPDWRRGALRVRGPGPRDTYG